MIAPPAADVHAHAHHALTNEPESLRNAGIRSVATGDRGDNALTISRDPAAVRGHTEPPASTPCYPQSHLCGVTEVARVSSVAKPSDERLAEIDRCFDETETRDLCCRRALHTELAHENLAVMH